MVLCLTTLWRGLNKMIENLIILSVGFMFVIGLLCVAEMVAKFFKWD
jgi:hypothetical protein